MRHMDLFTKQKQTPDIENRLADARGERFGGETSGRLGLADTNYYR